MVIGVGIDIIEINRIEKAISKNEAFIDKVYTTNERNYFESRNNRAEVFAGNFAVKEAVVKALGIGFVDIGLKDIEVLRDTLGKPYVILHNKAKKMLADNCTIHVSISHCHDYAVANAVIESLEKNEVYDFNFVAKQEV